MRQFRPLKVPKNVHPFVIRLFEEMNHNQIGMLDMAARSGVNVNTIKDWKTRCLPRLDNIEACYGVLGMRLMLTSSGDR